MRTILGAVRERESDWRSAGSSTVGSAPLAAAAQPADVRFWPMLSKKPVPMPTDFFLDGLSVKLWIGLPCGRAGVGPAATRTQYELGRTQLTRGVVLGA